MAESLARFERIVRLAPSVTEARADQRVGSHPFDERNIHPEIEIASRQLFDDGHYAQATFEAYKFVDKAVEKRARDSGSGVKLMMRAFDRNNPLIRLTPLSTDSDKDEQEGFKFIFAGSIMAIRNPRGHEVGLKDSPTECLDHLSLASMLLRRLDRVP